MARARPSAIGRHAERVVAEYLYVQGYSIVASNVRVGRLEVDLVARLGPLVALVEVRSRGESSFQSALSSIDGAKREHLLRAAARLMTTSLLRSNGIERVRIDVACVSFSARPPCVEYFPGAITAAAGTFY